MRLQLQLENALALTTADGAVFIEAIEVRPLVDYLREDFPGAARSTSPATRACAPIAAPSRASCATCCRTPSCTAAPRQVTLDLRRSASGAIEIVVTDDGGGADGGPSRPRSIVRSCGRPSTSGSGVGLYVCGRLLHQMHGQIRLLERAAVRVRREHRAAGGGVMSRVLLVEDDRSLGKTLAERLTIEGLDVEWVETFAGGGGGGARRARGISRLST